MSVAQAGGGTSTKSKSSLALRKARERKPALPVCSSGGAEGGLGSARTTGADVAQWQQRTECLFSLTKRDKTFAPPEPVR